jgi:DNA-binding PadR family transcriptional regulator
MCVRHAMLAPLSEGPQYGLRLRGEFDDRTGEVWPLNVGQVYTTLHRLERVGLAGSDGSAPSAGLTRGRRRVPDA